jgi:hypothetical protein
VVGCARLVVGEKTERLRRSVFLGQLQPNLFLRRCQPNLLRKGFSLIRQVITPLVMSRTFADCRYARFRAPTTEADRQPVTVNDPTFCDGV